MYSLFVGVDVSKDSFSAAGLDEKAKLVFSSAPEMNGQGFSWLREFQRRLPARITH
jgi:hypothetical protein